MSTEDDVIVMRNAGPIGAPGMPEAGYIPIPKKIAQKGIKDMVRMSDARMSGTAFGTIVSAYLAGIGSRRAAGACAVMAIASGWMLRTVLSRCWWTMRSWRSESARTGHAPPVPD